MSNVATTPMGFGELLAVAASNGPNLPPAITFGPASPLPPPTRIVSPLAETSIDQDRGFGQAELAAMLRRLRESKQRLQGDD